MADRLNPFPNPSIAVLWRNTIPQRCGPWPHVSRHRLAPPRQPSKWRSPDTAALRVSEKTMQHPPCAAEPAPPPESHPDAAMSSDFRQETQRAACAVFPPQKPTPPRHPAPAKAEHHLRPETRCTSSPPPCRDSESVPTLLPAPPVNSKSIEVPFNIEMSGLIWPAT